MTDHGQLKATGIDSANTVERELHRRDLDRGPNALAEPVVAVLDGRTGGDLDALGRLTIAVTLAELRRRLAPSTVGAFALDGAAIGDRTRR